jgi:AcrR family transcriptional regulator
MARLSPVERREQLLALGRELFAVRPYDALSIDEIAAAAGVSKGLLYHYFPTKRDFYAATVERAADELAAALDAAGDDTPTSLAGFLDFVEHNPGLYRSLFTAGIGADPEVQVHVGRVRSAAARQLARASGLDPKRERLRLAGAVGFVEAATLAWLDEPLPQRDRGTFAAMLLRGFTDLLRPGV